jgi:hypothetical protein
MPDILDDVKIGLSQAKQMSSLYQCLDGLRFKALLAVAMVDIP